MACNQTKSENTNSQKKNMTLENSQLQIQLHSVPVASGVPKQFLKG
jgi:hypothetical protein